MEPFLIHAGGLSLHHYAGRRFDLRWRGRSMMGPFTLHWELSGGHGQGLELSSQELVQADCRVSADGLEASIEYQPQGGARASVVMRLGEDGLELRQGLTATAGGGKQPLRVRAFRLNAAHLESSYLEGLGEGPGWRFFPTGYNSFSPAFARDSMAVLPMPRYYTAGAFNQYTDSVYWGKWSDLSTPWMATLHQAGMNGTLLAGFLESRVGVGEIALRRRKPTQLEARLSLGDRTLGEDETLLGDTLRLAFGSDGDGMIRDWTAEVARRMEARVPEGESPAGWCSWYYYYTDVTETDLHKNLEALNAGRRRLPVSYIQLDDGFQTAVGDWLSVNRKFRQGLGALAKRIKADGFVAGIWTAPFLVQRSAEVFRRHPAWLIKDREGRPKQLAYHPSWGVVSGQLYSLDLSHPEVLAHLKQVYTTLVGLGYDYFKIDFLMAGLQEGERFDASISPVEGYRKGLAVIREAIGERFLLGCGAPLMPSVGMVDAMRISSDVKEIWTDPVTGFIANGSGHPSAELAILNCLTRSHLHRQWWLNDPDCLLVRDQRSTLKLVEVQTLLTVLSLTGGMLFLSDDLSQLSPDRMALAELALPVGGTAARALGMRDEARPRRFVRTRALPDGRLEALAAVINWGENLEERSINPVDVGLPPGAYHGFEFWTRTYRKLGAGEQMEVTLDPHETALLLFRPVKPHPQLITATHHLGQTTVIVSEEHWEPTGVLTIGLKTGADRDGQVWVAVPEGFKLIDVEEEGGAQVTGKSHVPGAIRFSVPVKGEGRVRLRFN